MTLGQLLLLYLTAGVGVSAAVYLSSSAPGGFERGFQVVSAAVFWPMYLPVLLSYHADVHNRVTTSEAPSVSAPMDELSRAIAQVDAELDSALRRLDGWAEDVLAREKDRLAELRTAWTAQAKHIREMDRLLARRRSPPLIAGTDHDDLAERMRTSQQVIEQNRGLLRQVRDQTYQDLLGTMAWVRELVSMIHLAKFTGAPASRAEELVAQIAAAVEGLSALTWQEEGRACVGALRQLQK